MPERRLEWRVLVVHSLTFRQARAVLSGAGPLALVAAVQGRLGSFGLVGIVVVAAIASVAFSALRWWRFSYQLDGQRLLVRQGLLSRSERAVPLDRIRGVDVEAPPLHRLFRLAVLRVDAAAGGGGNEEAELDAVSAADADRLRAMLLTRRQFVPASPLPGVDVPWSGGPGPADVGAAAAGAGAEKLGQAPPAPRERVLARLDPRWLLYAPLMGGYLAVPLAVGGTLLRDVQDLPLPAGVRDLLDVPDRAGAGRIAVSVAGALVLVLLGALIAGAVSNWGFVLAERDGNLVAERGLLTRRTVSLERDRVRGFVLSAGLGLRLVRAARLRALVTGLGDQNRRGQLLPLGPLAVAERVAAEAVRRFERPLVAHPAAARRRRLMRALGLPAVVVVLLVAIGLATSFPPGLQVALAVTTALLVVAVPLGLDRYRGLGHAADTRALSLGWGSLVRHRVVLEQRAVVGWQVRQSVLQRRAGVMTLTVCVGAGAGGYDVLDCGVEQGLALVDQVSPDWARPLQPAG